MEPFFSCMKESKGLPLHTTASGSGAAVVPVVLGTVVWGGLVVVATSCVGVTASEIGVLCITGILWNMVSISPGGLVISSVVSWGCCPLRPKSERVCCLGLSWRLVAVEGDRVNGNGVNGGGVVPSNSSSSSSADTYVSPRAKGEKSHISDHLQVNHFDL